MRLFKRLQLFFWAKHPAFSESEVEVNGLGNLDSRNAQGDSVQDDDTPPEGKKELGMSGKLGTVCTTVIPVLEAEAARS